MTIRRHHWNSAAVRVGRDNTLRLELPAPEPWTEDALCAEVDTELFYPDTGASTRDARSVCRACPVIEQCLAYALKHNETFGVWGGTSPRERWKLQRARREPVLVAGLDVAS